MLLVSTVKGMLMKDFSPWKVETVLAPMVGQTNSINLADAIAVTC